MGKYIIYEGFCFVVNFVFFVDVFRNVIKYFLIFLKWKVKSINKIFLND